MDAVRGQFPAAVTYIKLKVRLFASKDPFGFAVLIGFTAQQSSARFVSNFVWNGRNCFRCFRIYANEIAEIELLTVKLFRRYEQHFPILVVNCGRDRRPQFAVCWCSHFKLHNFQDEVLGLNSANDVGISVTVGLTELISTVLAPYAVRMVRKHFAGFLVLENEGLVH